MQSRSYGPLAPVGLLPELKYDKSSYFFEDADAQMDLRSCDCSLRHIQGFNILNGCKWRFYVQVVLTEVKHGSGEMNHLNKRTMEISFSCVSHAIISCDCLKGLIHGFPVHFFFAFDVVSVVLMPELLDVQCFGKLTSSSTAVKNQKLMK